MADNDIDLYADDVDQDFAQVIIICVTTNYGKFKFIKLICERLKYWSGCKKTVGVLFITTKTGSNV